MPDRTVCPHCKKIGFVRTEHVLKGDASYRECYCGACERSWRVDDGRNVDDKPDRSRQK